MDLYQAIEKRKSIRKFKKETVPKEILDRIISAGTHAPSGKNKQNWVFFVLQGQKRDEYLKYSQKSWAGIKDILVKKLKPSLYEFTERFFYTLGDAPVVILCYSRNSDEENHLTSMGSVYMAVQNINLACVAEGLGCCTMGAPLELEEEINEFINISDYEKPEKGPLQLLCGIALGYPDHEPPKAPRQLEDRIYFL